MGSTQPLWVNVSQRPPADFCAHATRESATSEIAAPARRQ
jgi:hypothetical protein